MEFKICARCVTDTSDPDIFFDSEGVCNHCREAEKVLPTYRFSKEQEAKNLQDLADTLRSQPGKNYHAIIGLSGGVDSSYVTHLAKTIGIKPLMVHFDNGWNSERSVSNIKKLIEKCHFDLETYVIDWREFKDLQRSFFKSGVVDIEILTDHAIMATLFYLRKKYGIKYVLSGANYVTEHGMPMSWVWRKQDLANIKSIQKQFGSVRLKQFPQMSSIKFQLVQLFGWGGIYLQPLNLINYSMQNAIEVLKKEYNWEYYGEKHFESVFTKFYQSYVLPVKFGFDKRKPHLSALIRNGELTREQAIEKLKEPIYKPLEFKHEKEYLLKKLGFNETEFDMMMREKPVPHLAYGSDEWLFEAWRKYRPSFLRKIIGKYRIDK